MPVETLNWAEVPVGFPCRDGRLIGIVTVPSMPKPVGVVIVVGGPQYRAGSHRQFTLLARRLGGAGHPTIRFDHRGIGDSSGSPQVFEDLDDDIAAAIDELYRECPAVESIVLWGLCDAASASLLYFESRRDPRVAGMVLVNPWVRSEATLARVHMKHYYLKRLSDRTFWNKIRNGQVDLIAAFRSMLGAMINATLHRSRAQRPSTKSFQHRMANALSSFAGSVLLVLSGNDLTAKEFLETVANDSGWGVHSGRAQLERCDLPEADHTCSSPRAKGDLQRVTIAWLARAFNKNDP
jgi:exosortase A-associated hydrolase 1